MSDALSRFRAAFVPSEGAYLDTAHKGLLPNAAHAALLAHLEETRRGHALKERLIATAEECRALFATLIGAASPDEVAITKNVSEGVNTFANALDWQPGEEVILCPGFEHPNNLLPWLTLSQRGAVIREVPIAPDHSLSVEAMLAAIRPGRTRAVTVAAVSFSPGCRAALYALGAGCRERGVLLHVDAAQSLGAMAQDVQAECVDALSVGGQKALGELYGFGFLYVRQAIAERLRPPFLARFGVRQAGGHEDFTPGVQDRPAAGARRFDLGYPAFTGAVAMRDCLRLHLETGPLVIEAEALRLSALLADALEGAGMRVTRVPDGLRSHIVAAAPPVGDAAALHGALLAQEVRCSLRKGGLRLSVHAHTTEAEIALGAGACAAWLEAQRDAA